MYVRLFDVTWDKSLQCAAPVGTISFCDSVPSALAPVPVVFITNETFLNSPPETIPSLANHVFEKISGICTQNHLQYKEIQIDCDWSDKTQARYFEFLRRLSLRLSAGQYLSATIRLHQVKYRQITGVPPVKRGMLMFYNMGKISANKKSNSIYNEQDAGRYTQWIKHYPLPLDMALPAFSWGIHVRDGRVMELLNNLTSEDFLKNPLFGSTEPGYFKAKSSFFFRGFYFMQDDLVKIEQTSPRLTLAAARQLERSLNRAVRSVSIYHCDSLIFTRYEKSDFSKVFHCFH
ncbi:MAG: hypothetical protein Q8928_11735 [Bacteroidota bacterium]|nr:hypothetical protein [Bacteroidota bacterium]